MSTIPPRASRQEALAPWAALQGATVNIVGLGAVGRQTALMLASMGVPRFKLYDHDLIEDVNTGPQAYRPNQIGMTKVEATAADMKALNPDCEVEVNPRRFARSDVKALEGSFVFSQVDNMAGRKLVYETAAKAGAKWFGDTRTAGETIRVLAQSEPKEEGGYPKTLFEDSEAFSGSCTARMSIFTANISAGMLVAKFAQGLRGVLPPFTDDTLSLLSWELGESAA